MKYFISPAAEQELNNAADYYESQLPGLGNEFLIEVERTINLISRNPKLGVIYTDNIRRFHTRRFPFSVFYQINQNIIEVIAIADNRRSPGYWLDR